MSTRAADVQGGSNAAESLARTAVPGAAPVHRGRPRAAAEVAEPPGPRCAPATISPPAPGCERMGLVREGVERFARVRGAAELLHSDVVPRDLVVLQLPHATGDRWLALPVRPGAGRAAGRRRAHQRHRRRRGAARGLFVDGVDRDHPRPRGDDRPRVPPRRTGRPRSADHPARRPAGGDRPGLERRRRILDTLTEAQQLARIRGVGPDRLEWLGTHAARGRAARPGVPGRPGRPA